MKKFTFYLQLVAVLFLGSLIMSSCSNSSTDVEEDGLKPSSKPSFNYADYSYQSVNEGNIPTAVMLRSLEKRANIDLWQVRVQFGYQSTKDDVTSIIMTFSTPHIEEVAEANFILPGYYPLVIEDMTSHNLLPYKLYCGNGDDDEQCRIDFVTVMNPVGTPQLLRHIPIKGEVYIRQFGLESCDFEIRYLFDDHNPFYYNVNSSQLEKLYINWDL